jgi:hypothetical protein
MIATIAKRTAAVKTAIFYPSKGFREPVKRFLCESAFPISLVPDPELWENLRCAKGCLCAYLGL